MKTRLVYILPLTIFFIMAIYFAIGLTKDPKILPSVLIDKKAPEFTLPPIEGYTGPGRNKGISTADLKAGKVSVVNVFASWCVPCRAEHAVITRLAAMKIAKIYGLNYKDKPNDAIKWLKELGDPYTDIGADPKGRATIDWGVYGIPETFIVDGKGTIRYKRVGQVTDDILKFEMLPIIKKYSQ
ncbi:MAG: DsbE family thiol:disulfide interchange protein [Rhodospirillales bacterium]|nr:DsbE family thiol:disulfide interchange protein [Rhodospirillales bacterium]